MSEQRLSILVVCTGNICRSPMAEQLLRAGLAQWPEVIVSSAGTEAMVGKAMTEQAQVISRENGGQGTDRHVGRQLTVEQLREADLVLALTRRHRSQIVEMLPRGSRHTFTLREFARLLQGVTDFDLELAASVPGTGHAARLTELVEVAASRRGTLAPLDAPEDDDVIDPYKRDDAVYRESAGQLVPAVNGILAQFSRALALQRP